jgi:hypothetical protein
MCTYLHNYWVMGRIWGSYSRVPEDSVIRDVAVYRLVGSFRRFGGYCLIFLNCWIMKTKALRSFETSVTAGRHGVTSQMIWVCGYWLCHEVCPILQWLTYLHPHSCVALAHVSNIFTVLFPHRPLGREWTPLCRMSRQTDVSQRVVAEVSVLICMELGYLFIKK